MDGGPQTGVVFNFDATNSGVEKIDLASGLLEAKSPGKAVSSSLVGKSCENFSYFFHLCQIPSCYLVLVL